MPGQRMIIPKEEYDQFQTDQLAEHLAGQHATMQALTAADQAEVTAAAVPSVDQGPSQADQVPGAADRLSAYLAQRMNSVSGPDGSDVQTNDATATPQKTESLQAPSDTTSSDAERLRQYFADRQSALGLSGASQVDQQDPSKPDLLAPTGQPPETPVPTGQPTIWDRLGDASRQGLEAAVPTTRLGNQRSIDEMMQASHDLAESPSPATAARYVGDTVKGGGDLAQAATQQNYLNPTSVVSGNISLVNPSLTPPTHGGDVGAPESAASRALTDTADLSGAGSASRGASADDLLARLGTVGTDGQKWYSADDLDRIRAARTGAARPATGAPAETASAPSGLDAAMRDAFNAPPPAGPGLGERVRDTLGKLETVFTDSNAAVNRLGGGYKKGTASSVEAQMGTWAGAPEAGTQRAIEEARPVYEAVGAELLPDLNEYVGLQRYIETATVTKNPNRAGPSGLASVADAQGALAQLEERVGPDGWSRIQEADQLRQQVVKGLRDTLVRDGVLSSDLAAQLAAEQPHYNPTVISHYLEAVENRSAGGSIRQIGGTLKRLSEEGSSSDQLPPMQALLKAITDTDVAASKNRLLQEIVSSGGFKAEPVITVTTGRAIRPEAAAGDLATVITRQPRVERGYLYFQQNGKPMRAAVPSDIADVVDGMNKAQLGHFGRLFSAINTPFRTMATSLNPQFLVKNAIGDYAQSFVREGLLPPDVMAGYEDALKGGPFTSLYLRAGGGFGGAGSYYAKAGERTKSLERMESEILRGGGIVAKTVSDVKAIAGDVGRLNVVGALGEAKDMALAPIRTYGEAIERGPRVATFTKYLRSAFIDSQGHAPTSRAELLAWGRDLLNTDPSALAPAALEGRRVTIDFNRAGTLVRELNGFTPFLSARVGGWLSPLRTLREKGAGTAGPLIAQAATGAAARMAGVMALGAGLYAWNRQFPEYQDVPDYIKSGFAVVMLPGSEKNATGPGYKSLHYIALPVREYASLLQSVEAFWQHAEGKDSEAVDSIMNALNASNPLPGEGASGVLGSMLPPALKTIGELDRNENLFRGGPIVSEGMKRATNGAPQLQYTERTTELAKQIAVAVASSPVADKVPEWLKSPIMIDHLIGGELGGGGTLAAQGISTLMGQPSDNTPVLGGLLAGANRTYGGQVRQDAYDARDAGIRRIKVDQGALFTQFAENGAPIQDPPSEIAKVPLNPDEQLRYEQILMDTVPQEMAKAQREGPTFWRGFASQPLERRQAAMREVLTRARSTTEHDLAKELLASVGREALKQRNVDAAAAPAKAFLQPTAAR